MADFKCVDFQGPLVKGNIKSSGEANDLLDSLLAATPDFLCPYVDRGCSSECLASIVPDQGSEENTEKELVFYVTNWGCERLEAKRLAAFAANHYGKAIEKQLENIELCLRELTSVQKGL